MNGPMVIGLMLLITTFLLIIITQLDKLLDEAKERREDREWIESRRRQGSANRDADR